MDFVTVGLIVFTGWVSILVAVVAMCKAAAFGDSEGADVLAAATESARAPRTGAAGERSRRFEQPALG